MKTAIGIVTLGIGLLNPVTAFSDTGFLDRSVMRNGQTYRYQVYVPVESTPAQNWPVVLFLHGNGSQGSDGSRQTSGGTPTEAILENRARFPAIFVFPQARESTWWTTPLMQAMALAAFDVSVKEFNGDPDRAYLMGFSNGGGGALRIASRFPNKFAAIVEVAGSVVTQPGWSDSRRAEDQQAHAYLSASDPYAALAAAIKHLPIRVFHGDSDKTVPVEHSRKLVAALEVTAADVHYTEYPQTDHVTANDKAWVEPDLMTWLLAQRRKH